MKGDLKTRLMRAVHGEAKSRGLDHAALSEVCRLKFGVESMAELDAGQMQTLYHDWTGRALRTGRPALPRRGYGRQNELAMASGEELELLERAFARRGWGPETKRTFVRRQIGHDEIRTRRDFWRVFSGVRAMNRREGL